MSISKMIESNSEFQKIIRNAIPNKCDFKTVSGRKAFSDYEMPYPYSIDKTISGTVGTAFDYLARVMVARVLEGDKKGAFLELKALKGLQSLCENNTDSKTCDLLREKYSAVLTDFIDYIYSEQGMFNISFDDFGNEEWKAWRNYVDRRCSNCEPILNIDQLIEGAYYFAKLEEVYRSGRRYEGVEDIILEPCDEAVQDLSNLCKLFMKNFINAGMVSPDDIVVFNPSFFSGADADIYINGVLYDFKTTRSKGYNWKDVAQLTTYYCLNQIERSTINRNKFSRLKKYHISSIAFYKARFGEIEYCQIESFCDKEKENVNKIKEYFRLIFDMKR